MTQDSTTSETSKNRTDNQSTVVSKVPRQAVLTVALLTLFAVQPAAAQTSAVCSADNLPSMIEGFFQLTTGLGIVGPVSYTHLLKRHKRSAMKSAVVLVVLGPLYTVAGSMMGLPLAQCVDLVPW
ncbi:hypothetical protein C474_14129 [Halogeometricum pallidum JCM 14848]|uniref:Uncharacterized protein n=1 Tax=Halogeometricum pallidum JCM 14848 TaxID=1227487 RepID=M0CZJ6_HALPD|nr:hypothetical protein [Halogeometricum pallidum]ELZ28640.1 hypothetical protein C474_14129 [Halogeometricum pallidum JCM 14848]